MIALRRIPLLLFPLLMLAACDDDPSQPSSTLALSEVSVAFTGEEGGAGPLERQIAISSPSGGSFSNLSVSTTYLSGSAEGWLNATLTSTTTPATLVLAPALGELDAGNYSAVVILTAPGAANSPRGIAVTLTVEGASGPKVFSYTPPAGAPEVTSISVRGEFNGWGESPMTLDGDTWSVALPLDEGEYEYKFYINGGWPGDMCNDATWGQPGENYWIDPAAEGCASGNAVTTVSSTPRHIWRYKHPEGAPAVTSVSVRGSFNDWGETPMILLGDTWRLGMDLPGSYEYKFFINGGWPGDMCNDATWGDPANNLWIDPDADGCNGGNATITID